MAAQVKASQAALKAMHRVHLQRFMPDLGDISLYLPVSPYISRCSAGLEQAMAHLAGNCLALMYERSAEDGYKCEPDIFFHHLGSPAHARRGPRGRALLQSDRLLPVAHFQRTGAQRRQARQCEKGHGRAFHLGGVFAVEK